MGALKSMMPPWMLPATPDLVCRFRVLMPSTTRRCAAGTVRTTLPRLPRSLPAITSTVSPERMSKRRARPRAQPLCLRPTRVRRSVFALTSEHLRGKADDLHEVALTEFARHRAEDARSARAVVRLDEHGRVLIEADVAAVGTVVFLDRTHHHGADDIALLHLRVRLGDLDGTDDHVPDRRVLAVAAAEHADAEDLAGTTVVRHLEDCFLLDHLLGLFEHRGDAHAIADAALVGLVMDLEASVDAHHLLVEGVRLLLLDEHDARLLHLVADHHTLAHLAARADCGCLGLGAHTSSSSASTAPSLLSVSVGAASAPAPRDRGVAGVASGSTVSISVAAMASSTGLWSLAATVVSALSSTAPRARRERTGATIASRAAARRPRRAVVPAVTGRGAGAGSPRSAARRISTCTVMVRAISMRMARIWRWFSTWPMVCWRRTWKSCPRCSRRCCASSSPVRARRVSRAAARAVMPSPRPRRRAPRGRRTWCGWAACGRRGASPPWRRPGSRPTSRRACDRA